MIIFRVHLFSLLTLQNKRHLWQTAVMPVPDSDTQGQVHQFEDIFVCFISL